MIACSTIYTARCCCIVVAEGCQNQQLLNKVSSIASLTKFFSTSPVGIMALFQSLSLHGELGNQCWQSSTRFRQSHLLHKLCIARQWPCTDQSTSRHELISRWLLVEGTVIGTPTPEQRFVRDRSERATDQFLGRERGR
jgi:hypothetical protein